MNTKKNRKSKIKKTPYEIKENVKYFTKNRLPAFVLAGLMILWTIASVLGIIGYCRTKPKNTAMVTASADATNNELTTEFKIPLYGLAGLTCESDYEVLQWLYYVNVSNNTAWLSVNTDNGEDRAYCGVDTTEYITATYRTGSVAEVDELEIYCEQGWNYNIEEDYTYFYPYAVYYRRLGEQTFVLDITVEFRYFRETVGNVGTNTLNFQVYTSFTNDRESTFILPIFNERVSADFVAQDIATQFVDQNNNGIAQLTYERNYYEYLSQSNQIAVQGAYNEGYAIGKKEGYNNGYEVGVVAGASSANEYTFDGLLSAVFDVPVRVFTDLFNFDILGVNLTNFFLSLLTLAVIIAILRWVL